MVTSSTMTVFILERKKTFFSNIAVLIGTLSFAISGSHCFVKHLGVRIKKNEDKIDW